MLAPVEIASGQVSAADDMSSATTVVRNFQVDVAGVNRMRPALMTYTTTGLGSSPLTQLYRWKTFLVGVTVDRKIYAISDGFPTVWVALSDATAATQLDGTARPVFAEDASDLFIAGGGAIQKWTGAGLTARLGGTSPTDCTHLVNLAQRLVANTAANPSRIVYSDLGDGNDSSWPALNFATAEARPDNIVAIGENTAELAIWGQTTTEAWGTTTDPLAPYQRINTLNTGMSAPYSAVRFDNYYLWLDDKRRFVKSDCRSYEVISGAIDKDLRGLMTVSDCWGYREDTDLGGVIVWVFPTAQRTFSYDYSSKRCAERNYYTAPFNGAWPVNCHAYWNSTNLNIVGVSTSASVCKLDTTARQDLGGTMVAERITGWQDFGTKNKKRSAKVQAIMRRGTTPLASVDGQLEVAVANDGGGWSSFRRITIGQPGDQEMTKNMHFGGVFRKRRYWMRYSGSDDFSLVDLSDDVTDLGPNA